MLQVKTKLKESKIHGLGLFADQFIPKGTVTWRFNPQFDIYFDPIDVSNLPEPQRELIIEHAFLSKKSGKYVYSIDNTRFTNHSSNPNIEIITSETDPEFPSVANRDIQIGEEMTVDYRVIDSGDEKMPDEYLKN